MLKLSKFTFFATCIYNQNSWTRSLSRALRKLSFVFDSDTRQFKVTLFLYDLDSDLLQFKKQQVRAAKRICRKLFLWNALLGKVQHASGNRKWKSNNNLLPLLLVESNFDCPFYKKCHINFSYYFCKVYLWISKYSILRFGIAIVTASFYSTGL